MWNSISSNGFIIDKEFVTNYRGEGTELFLLFTSYASNKGYEFNKLGEKDLVLFEIKKEIWKQKKI